MEKWVLKECDGHDKSLVGCQHPSYNHHQRDLRLGFPITKVSCCDVETLHVTSLHQKPTIFQRNPVSVRKDFAIRSKITKYPAEFKNMDWAVIGTIAAIVAIVAAVAWTWKRHQQEQAERLRLAKLEEQQRLAAEHQRLAQLQEQQRQQEQVERLRLLAELEEQKRLVAEHHRLAQLQEQQCQQQAAETGSFIAENQPNVAQLERHGNKLKYPEIISNLTSKIAELLASGRWKEADEETFRILLSLAGREKKGSLKVESIQELPSEYICMIDQLWLKASNERFGLSVQKRIWKSVGGNIDCNDQVYRAFGRCVGWRRDKHWLELDELTFNYDAPPGHLPAIAVRLGGLSWGIKGFSWDKRAAYVFLLEQKEW